MCKMNIRKALLVQRFRHQLSFHVLRIYSLSTLLNNIHRYLRSFYCKYRVTSANNHCTEQILSPSLKTWDNHANMYGTNLLLQVKCSHRNTPHLYKVRQLPSAGGFYKMRQKCYIRQKCCLNSVVKISPITGPRCPEGSRKLRFPDYVTMAQDGGKVVSLMHRPLLPLGNTPGTHFCQRLSRPQRRSAIGGSCQ